MCRAARAVMATLGMIQRIFITRNKIDVVQRIGYTKIGVLYSGMATLSQT